MWNCSLIKCLLYDPYKDHRTDRSCFFLIALLLVYSVLFTSKTDCLRLFFASLLSSGEQRFIPLSLKYRKFFFLPPPLPKAKSDLHVSGRNKIQQTYIAYSFIRLQKHDDFLPGHFG